MPELPEVETIRQDLSRLIVGKKILEIETDSPKQARLDSTACLGSTESRRVKSRQVKPSVEVVKKAVVGAKIVKIKRRAKLLQVFLSNRQILAIHLKLTGRLLLRKKTDPQDDWQRVTITLSGGKELRFCDLRKFGWIKLVTNDELRIMNKELGIEPITPEFTLEKFSQILKSTSRAIKIVLMDQKKIAGIGNIYANDASFLAGIDPRKPAEKLSAFAKASAFGRRSRLRPTKSADRRNSEIEKLREAIEKVLKAGIKYRGASDQYYLDALGQKGSYQDHFLVYGREGKKCFNCGGKIKRIKLGGRGTFFCPKCQK